MKYYVYLITALLILVGFTLGCVDNKNNNEGEADDVFFSFYYSTSSDVEETIFIRIVVLDNEIFNETVVPVKGALIYNERSRGNSYRIYVEWDNRTAKGEFKPNGSNTLFLVIRFGNINLKEVTD